MAPRRSGQNKSRGASTSGMAHMVGDHPTNETSNSIVWLDEQLSHTKANTGSKNHNRLEQNIRPTTTITTKV
jgi:hypothetical protein